MDWMVAGPDDFEVVMFHAERRFSSCGQRSAAQAEEQLQIRCGDEARMMSGL
jgi:hypothetical protein